MPRTHPPDWPQISRLVRFERAKGRCEQCGCPHGFEVRCLPDGRWFDAETQGWRDARGHAAVWPDVVDYARYRSVRVVLAACRRDHDLPSDDPDNLIALCRRCQLHHGREVKRDRFRVTILQRRALGDLFQGAYR